TPFKSVPLSLGIAVHFPSETVSSFRRNRCPVSVGITVQFASEYARKVASLHLYDGRLTRISYSALFQAAEPPEETSEDFGFALRTSSMPVEAVACWPY